MIKERLQQAINEQINKEFYSAYLYLSMSAYAESINLKGFANWLKVQYHEENAHAEIFFNYLNERGGRVLLKEIAKPQENWQSITEVFEKVLEHERSVTESINKLMDLAIEERDHATVSFLKWFVDEQVEEEANAEEILNNLKLAEGNKGALFMLDKEMATRTYVPPAPLQNKE